MSQYIKDIPKDTRATRNRPVVPRVLTVDNRTILTKEQRKKMKAAARKLKLEKAEAIRRRNAYYAERRQEQLKWNDLLQCICGHQGKYNGIHHHYKSRPRRNNQPKCIYAMRFSWQAIGAYVFIQRRLMDEVQYQLQTHGDLHKLNLAQALA